MAANTPVEGKSTAFDRLFSKEQQRELLDEDREAWRAVCSVLFSIVGAGLLLGLAGVLLSL